MGNPKLDLYFDIVSPFGYMAYYLMRNSPVFKPCEINYIPIFLGGVMKATGNRPPLEVPKKFEWINIERRRWASLYNIPMPHDGPDNFPVLTLTIQRALTAITLLSPSHLPPAIDACYAAYWADRNVSRVDQPAVLQKTLAGVLGEGLAKQVMEASKGDEAKKLLNHRGEEATKQGAFGVPWMVVTDKEGKTESFWGFDHLGQVTTFLGLEKPRAGGGWQAML